MKSIDQSHLTVLANFDTLQRAQQCVEEIKSYIADVLRDLASELPESSTPPFGFVFEGEYIDATAFPKNWGGTEFPLISIGVEHLDLPNMLGAEGAEGWRGYIYSLLLNDPARVAANQSLAANLRSLQPPDGYVPAPPNIPGYFFIKKLPGIPVDAFRKRKDLKESVSRPLIELSDWLRANGQTITAFAAT